uniref:DUF6521 family protein n=1 Tax=Bosea sp. NBC_00436 TaxID=2969620 RepID=A0A9E7ZMH7_9HYPH
MDRNPGILINLAIRVDASLGIVTEGLRFGCFSQVLRWQGAHILRGPTPIKKVTSARSGEAVAGAMKRAERMGYWLAAVGSQRAVFSMMGLAQAKAHLQGRVSYFLEASAEEPRQSLPDLNVLRAQIVELEAQVDRETKRIKLRRAETKISQFASDILAQLPTVAPCVGSELEFTVRRDAPSADTRCVPESRWGGWLPLPLTASWCQEVALSQRPRTMQEPSQWRSRLSTSTWLAGNALLDRVWLQGT